MIAINAVKVAEKQSQQRISAIESELDALDRQTIRPLRAAQSGTATKFDTDKLAELETQAATLRTELAGLL